MPTRLLRLPVLSSLSFVLAGCGPSISGEYGGDDCFFDKLTFSGEETVYITAFGTEAAGTYRLDGDRVILNAGPAEMLVFTEERQQSGDDAPRR